MVERDGLGGEGELIQVHPVHKAELFHLQSHLCPTSGRNQLRGCASGFARLLVKQFWL